MISTGDFKKGTRILVDGEPYSVETISVQSPSARGAATLVRCKLRQIVSGSQIDRTFKAGEKFEAPDIGMRRIQFLYDDGSACHFMDIESYDQFEIADERIDEIRPWLVEEMQLNSVMWNGTVAGVSLPQFVEATVDMVGGGARGDTAGGKNLKDATLTNGKTIKVPLFIDSGEKILVDPTTGEFVRRAEKAGS